VSKSQPYTSTTGFRPPSQGLLQDIDSSASLLLGSRSLAFVAIRMRSVGGGELKR